MRDRARRPPSFGASDSRKLVNWWIGELVNYIYETSIVEVLSSHGLKPQSSTPPAAVRDALSDLYRYEIRRLKQQLLRHEFPKEDYSRRVTDLRRKYWLLSVPVAAWARSGS